MTIVTQTSKPATAIPVEIIHQTLGAITIEIVVPTEDDKLAEQIAWDVLSEPVELSK